MVDALIPGAGQEGLEHPGAIQGDLARLTAGLVFPEVGNYGHKCIQAGLENLVTKVSPNIKL